MGLPERIANSPTPGTAAALTTLSGNGGSITAAAASMKTAAAAPTALQGTGQCRVLVDSEIMIVDTSTTSTTTWTIITRGAEGSTAAIHNDGASVYHPWTKDSMTNFAVSSTNPPTAARAYRNGAFTCANIWGKVNLDTKDFDPGSNFDVTTNRRYICPVDGVYSCTWIVQNNFGPASHLSAIYKNGSVVANGFPATTTGTSGGSWGSVGAVLLQCVATDYFEMWHSTATTGAGLPGATNTYLSVVRVA